MIATHTLDDVIAFLGKIAGELAEIHRGKHYGLWRRDTRRSRGRNRYRTVAIMSNSGAAGSWSNTYLLRPLQVWINYVRLYQNFRKFYPDQRLN